MLLDDIEYQVGEGPGRRSPAPQRALAGQEVESGEYSRVVLADFGREEGPAAVVEREGETGRRFGTDNLTEGVQEDLAIDVGGLGESR